MQISAAGVITRTAVPDLLNPRQPGMTYPTSQRPAPASAGFSLIELLAILLIIGLGVGLVSFRISDNSAYQLRIDAKQLANNAALLTEEAVLSGEQWGIDLYLEVDDQGRDQYGYRWLHKLPDRWEVKAIDSMQTDNLFHPSLAMELELEGVDQEIGFKQAEQTRKVENVASGPDEAPLEPDIWLLSSGEVTPFRLRILEWQEEGLEIVIIADQLGRIELQGNEDLE